MQIPDESALVRENELLILELYDTADFGVVDQEGLELAVRLARESPTFREAAAELVVTIVREKPFRAGNYGTALLAADLTYALNLHRLNREPSFVEMIELVEQREIEVPGVSKWLQLYSRPLFGHDS